MSVQLFTESDLERRTKEKMEERGISCFHLIGPDGWPDLSCYGSGVCKHIEFKVQRGRASMVEIMEPTQPAFFYKHCNDFSIYIVIQFDDGAYGVKHVYPRLALDLRNWTVRDFRSVCQEYTNFDNLVKNLCQGLRP
jgi:hypothetical protein